MRLVVVGVSLHVLFFKHRGLAVSSRPQLKESWVNLVEHCRQAWIRALFCGARMSKAQPRRPVLHVLQSNTLNQSVTTFEKHIWTWKQSGLSVRVKETAGPLQIITRPSEPERLRFPYIHFYVAACHHKMLLATKRFSIFAAVCSAFSLSLHLTKL